MKANNFINSVLEMLGIEMMGRKAKRNP